MKENVHIFRLLFLMWEREAWLHCTESIPVFFSSGLSMSHGTSIPQQCFTPVTGHYRKSKKPSELVDANLCSAADLSCVCMAHLIMATFHFPRI